MRQASSYSSLLQKAGKQVMTEIHGADVSRYQNLPILGPEGKVVGYRPINFDKMVSQGVKFCGVRFTVGNYYVDPCAEQNFKGALKKGIYPIPYLVSAPRNRNGGTRISAKEHTEFFLDVLKTMPKLRWQMVAVDNELNRGEDVRYITDLIWKIFGLLAVDKVIEPLNYTRKTWWDSYVLPSSHWKDIDLWVANYGVSKPALPRDYNDYYIHQYSADENKLGSAYGVWSTPIDLNRMAGDLPDLVLTEDWVEAAPTVSVPAKSESTPVDNISVVVDGVSYRLVKG